MNLRRVLLATCIFLLGSVPALAQQGKIVFEESSHSFGTIAEGTEAVHVFGFRNEGDAPLHLTRVRPSCGCTTPEWTSEAVPPGGTGRIKVVYDSEGRPGPFTKTIDVWSDGTPGHVTLQIDGNVRTKPLPNAVALGNLLVDEPSADLGTIEHGVEAVETFQIQNNGTAPIRIRNASVTGDNVQIVYPEDPLLPGDVENVVVFVDTSPVEVGAPFHYTVTLETDDSARPAKPLEVRGSTSSPNR